MQDLKRLWIGLLAFLVWAPEVVRAGTVVQLAAEADVAAPSDQPGKNFGADPMLWVQPANPESRSFVRFDLSSIPAGALIHDAELALSNQLTTDLALDACAVKEPWNELSLTWDQQPAEGLCFDRRLVTPNALTWEVTGLVQEWVDGASANHGIVLRAQTGGTDLASCSCQDGRMS